MNSTTAIRFLFAGALSASALAAGAESAALDASLRSAPARVAPLIAEGSHIPHTDHSCPPDIPFANCGYYLNRLSETCQRGGRG